MTDRFVVISRCAKMPSTCHGMYRRVGVVEVVDPTKSVYFLAERDRNVKRVVRTWERLNVGVTEKCAFRRALVEANDLAEQLNKETEHAQQV